MGELRALLAREWRDLRALVLVLAAIPVLLTAFECAFPSAAPLPWIAAGVVQPTLTGIFLVVVGSASFAGMPGSSLDGLLLSPVGTTRVWCVKLLCVALVTALLSAWSLGLQMGGFQARDALLVHVFQDWLVMAGSAYMLAIAAGCCALWLAAALRSSFHAVMMSTVLVVLFLWLARSDGLDQYFWIGAESHQEVRTALAVAAAFFAVASRLSFSPWWQNASLQRRRVLRGVVLPAAVLLGATGAFAAERASWAWMTIEPTDERVQDWAIFPCAGGKRVVITYWITEPCLSFGTRFLDLETGEASEVPGLPTSCQCLGEGLDGSALIIGHKPWPWVTRVYLVDPETLEIRRSGPLDGESWWKSHLTPPRAGDWGEAHRYRRSGDRVRVRWNDRSFELNVPADAYCRCSAEPGVLLYGAKREGLVRVDLETGERRTILPAGDEPMHIGSYSHDREHVIVRRLPLTTSVHRTSDGSLVAGPWVDTTAVWADARGESRYLQLLGDRRMRIHDLATGRTIPLEREPGKGGFPRILEGGRMLVQSGKRLELFGADGHFLRTVWPIEE